MSEEGKKNIKSEEKTKENKSKPTRIPLHLVPNEADEVADEMRRIFDEDKVVHRHGSSEPESD